MEKQLPYGQLNKPKGGKGRGSEGERRERGERGVAGVEITRQKPKQIFREGKTKKPRNEEEGKTC